MSSLSVVMACVCGESAPELENGNFEYIKIHRDGGFEPMCEACFFEQANQPHIDSEIHRDKASVIWLETPRKEVTPQILVWPVVAAYKRLDRYLAHGNKPGSGRLKAGQLAYQTIMALERTERHLRAMYSPDYSGL